MRQETDPDHARNVTIQATESSKSALCPKAWIHTHAKERLSRGKGWGGWVNQNRFMAIPINHDDSTMISLGNFRCLKTGQSCRNGSPSPTTSWGGRLVHVTTECVTIKLLVCLLIGLDILNSWTRTPTLAILTSYYNFIKDIDYTIMVNIRRYPSYNTGLTKCTSHFLSCHLY